MNRQRRADERSKALHKEIAIKLRNQPDLWYIPKNNLMRWEKMRGRLVPALSEWEQILNTKTREHILSILEGDSEESNRLRSSSPFVGILNQNERRKIFESYRIRIDDHHSPGAIKSKD
jgi:hypothetical protein